MFSNMKVYVIKINTGMKNKKNKNKINYNFNQYEDKIIIIGKNEIKIRFTTNLDRPRYWKCLITFCQSVQPTNMHVK